MNPHDSIPEPFTDRPALTRFLEVARGRMWRPQEKAQIERDPRLQEYERRMKDAVNNYLHQVFYQVSLTRKTEPSGETCFETQNGWALVLEPDAELQECLVQVRGKVPPPQPVLLFVGETRIYPEAPFDDNGYATYQLADLQPILKGEAELRVEVPEVRKPTTEPQPGPDVLSNGEVFGPTPKSHHDNPRVPASGGYIRPLCWASAAAAMAVCLLVVYHHFMPSVRASVEPDPWHEIDGLSKAALTRQFPDFLALSYRCDPVPWKVVSAKPVDRVPDPHYEGFEILQDSKVFDLSLWKPVALKDVSKGRISPVFMTRVQVLRRRPGHLDNKYIRYKYWTEGYCVDPKKTTARDVIREGKMTDPRGTRECRVWELEIDVSNHPEGEVFTLATSAIFWNGFPDEPNQWCATAVGSPSIQSAEFGVILPADRHIKSWSLWKYSSGKQRPLPENQLKAGHPPQEGSGILYWPIAQIDPGFTYEIQWTW